MGLAFSPYFKLKLFDLSDDTSIIATGDRTETHTPPAGKVHQIVFIQISIPDPAGSSAGTHKLYAHYGGTQSAYNALFRLTANTGTSISTYYSSFIATGEVPSASDEQQLLITGGIIWCSNDYPLKFLYENDTDVAQAGTRIIKLLVKEYNEMV